MVHMGAHLQTKLLMTLESGNLVELPRIWVKTFDFCCAHGTLRDANQSSFELINY